MSSHHMHRTASRTGLAGALALTATLALAGTAYAHAEVTADTPRALAEDVKLTFTSEAESDSAGFTQLRIVLPKGIAPGDVSLDKGPKGWKMSTNADGYTLAGPKLPVGTDAEHTIKVRQLPDAKQLVFRTVETYSDGKLSRWIEVPHGGEEPEQPAPVLKLKAARPGATPVKPSPSDTPSPRTTPSPKSSSVPSSTSEASGEKNASAEKDSSSSAPLIAAAAAGLVVIGAGGWWLVRRRKANGGN
ncbi:YcnI family protein [Streptomyces caniferus]|uniref:DUF1775 domain-containing protein n=1 Tax=Streptomyces caniferus TaxID=285557 RepID=UPI002E29B999|nr:DUF1775 domain-containing protein [Streptomyces caniferus]